MFGYLTLGPYWDTLGWIFFKRGDLESAVRYCHAAWLVNPLGAIGDHLGQAYEQLGRKADAMRAYAMAMKGESPKPETRGRLAALAGGTARADRLAEQAEHTAFQEMRTIQLGHLTRASIAGEVRVLLAPGPRVEDVRVDEGSPALTALAAKLRGAGPTSPTAHPSACRCAACSLALRPHRAARSCCSLCSPAT